ncbi:NB-ARC domain-containing protein [Armatimonas sp.]|uniref:NB-ARC domain-containing protein n=1 Tax=Armatimonas sp. TaxID=1872638 RepID=UPI0037532CE6
MNERWWIELLGELRLVRGARTVTRLSSRKTEALLAYLALQPGRAFPREVLADIFWPEAPPESARHSLRMALSSLRKLFGEGLSTDNQTVRLRQEAVHTDVSAFEEAVQAEHWGEAVGHYRGALLPGVYDDWVVPQQIRLADLFGFAACHWIAEATERTIALDRAVRTVALAPHHPDLLAALERLQPQGEGHVGEIPPSRLPETLNPTGTRVAPRGVPAKPVLPLKLTRFIGRESELTRLQNWLVPGSGTRLVTLTGPGGSGKTRLAIELAQRSAVTSPDVIWFLSLSELSSAVPLTDALRRTLGLADTAEHDPLEPIAGVLREPTAALLILDNAEQQIDAVGDLTAALLTRAPGLRCLVTSRRRLDVEGERELPLLPMSADEALVLFEDRAQVARADFSLTDTNRASVAALCQRLDGLPLALEIAAARVSVLSPAQLLARIGERLDFYSRQQREVRHRSLRAAIQTSYELLPLSLQRIFTRLVVFSSGWTQEDAQCVLGESDLLEELEALRAHSLLHYASAPDAPVVRFGMLETLATFAREQLDTVEAEALAQCHAAHFFDLGIAAGPAVSRVTPEWRTRCSAAYENLQATLDWLRLHDPSAPRLLSLRSPLTGLESISWRKGSAS